MMSTHRSKVIGAVLAVTLMASLSACASGSAAPAQSTSGPKGEGTLTLYTARDPQEISQLISDFTAATGQQVQVFASTAANVTSKVLSESASGAHTADVIDFSGDANLYQLQQAKTLKKLPKAITSLLPKQDSAFTSPDEDWMSVTANFRGIAYNNQLVKGSHIPKTFKDFLDPWWKGKFSVPIPTTAGSVSGYYQMTKQPGLGKAFLTDLGNNDPVVIAHSGDQVSQMITGDQLGGLVDDNAVWEQIAAGAPLTYVYPKDGMPAVRQFEALAAGAPHPIAAELFLKFLTTKKAQNDLAATGAVITWPGSKSVPSSRPTIEEMKIWLAPDPTELVAAQTYMVPFLAKVFHQ